MEDYLGETEINISETKFASYKEKDWALHWIKEHGFLEGERERKWLIKQIKKILKGAEIEMKIARWGNGHKEERFSIKPKKKQK